MGKIKPLYDTFYSSMDLVENYVEKGNESGKNGVLGVVEGPFAEIDTWNRNDRKYYKSLWENKVLKSDYVSEMLNNKTLLGEADHPEERFEISIPNVSHSITDLWIDEEKNVVMGKADILDTPMGRIAHTLVEYGSKIGISARAAGSLIEKDKGFIVDEDDYVFFTFDFVLNPGFESSRLSLISEGKEEDEKEYDSEELIELRNSLLSYVDSSEKSELKTLKTAIGSSSSGFYKDIIEEIDKRLDDGDNPVKDNISLLEESYKKLYDVSKEKERLESELKDLRDKVNCLSQEKSREKKLESRLSVVKDDFKEARDKCLELKNVIQEYRNKLGRMSGLKEENKDLNSELNNLKEDIKQLQSEVDRKEYLLSKRDNLLEELGSDFDKCKSKLSKTNSVLESVKEDIKEKDDEIEDLQEKLEDKNAVINKLENKVGKLGSVRKKLEVKENQLRSYIVSSISGRLGVSRKVVLKYLPEKIVLDKLSNVERKIKRDLGLKKNSEFDDVIEVTNVRNLSSEKQINEDQEVDKLSSLVNKVKNK